MPAGRLPCSRGALRVSSTNDPWCHGPGPRPCTTFRVASPSTGAAELIREPESKGTLNPTPSHPRTAPRGLAAPPCPSGVCLASEPVPHPTPTPERRRCGRSEQSSCRRCRRRSGREISARREAGRIPGSEPAHSAPPEPGASLCHLSLGGGRCREVTRCATGALRLHRRSREELCVLSGPRCSHLVHWSTREANQTKA